MIFNFLKRIFGRHGSVAASAPDGAAESRAVVARAVEKPKGGGLEMASLSLRAILDKLPSELRATVNQMPDAGVMVGLPVNTVLKQLPVGSVKMSLASLVRQAPQGTFRKTTVEDKQMVDVPLAEIFKCLDVSRLSRRSDQRHYDVPEGVTGLFGKNGASRKVTPATSSEEAVPFEAPEKPLAPPTRIEPSQIVRMPDGAPTPSVPAVVNGQVAANGSTASAKAAAPKPSATSGTANSELVVSFVELASGWPEGIRNELSLLPGDTKVVIPACAVSGGLQQGKVVFPWSQVRMWLRPGLSAPVAIAEDFKLLLPLKVLAPAFVAATGALKRRAAAEIDHSLPDFFGPAAGQRATQSLAEPLEILPVAPAPAVSEPVEVVSEKVEVVPFSPVREAPELSFQLVREEPAPIVEEAKAVVSVVAPVVESASSPAEIVERACELPGVAGAVVALEEGLVIAQKLPPGFSADTFAAFMPQIFGRLEKYTSEMQLGAAATITIESANGPCHIARLGKVYFGAVGRTGEKLPDGLGILSEQLAAHNS